MEKLQEMWENLQLNEEERVAIDIEGEGLPEVLRKGDRSLLTMQIRIVCVESGRPWFFDGHMFVMNAFDGYTPLSKMSFDVAAYFNFKTCLKYPTKICFS